MSEAPKVYCPKEDKEVPIWHCIGSFTQGRRPCPNCIAATIIEGKQATVKCKLDEKKSGG